MTNRRSQGFIRLALSVLRKALKITPDNEKIIELESIFRSMLEDDRMRAISSVGSWYDLRQWV